MESAEENLDGKEMEKKRGLDGGDVKEGSERRRRGNSGKGDRRRLVKRRKKTCLEREGEGRMVKTGEKEKEKALRWREKKRRSLENTAKERKRKMQRTDG